MRSKTHCINLGIMEQRGKSGNLDSCVAEVVTGLLACCCALDDSRIDLFLFDWMTTLGFALRWLES